jgi:hypothetical protein
MALATIIVTAAMALGAATLYDMNPDARTAVVTIALFVLGIVGGALSRALLGRRFPPNDLQKLPGIWW